MSEVARAYKIERYQGEEQIGEVIALMEEDLSEPYSIFTYRYFLQQWPELAFLAYLNSDATGTTGQPTKPIGAIVCKLEPHKSGTVRGYIAMLAVSKPHRRLGTGAALVRCAIAAMADRADEVALETEICNHAALAFYARLGFVREKRLLRYYMNGGDAFQLVLPLRPASRLTSDSPDLDLEPGPEPEPAGSAPQ
jgi:peptide alpha-N-acetyltransferase